MQLFDDLKKHKYHFALIIAGIVVLLAIILNFTRFLNLLGWLWGVISPLVLGGCIAFVLNIFMESLNHRFLNFIKKDSIREIVSLITAFVLLILLIVAILAIAVPELVSSFRLLSVNIPKAYDSFKVYLHTLTKNNAELDKIVTNFTTGTDSLRDIVSKFISSDLLNYLFSTITYAGKTIGIIFTWVIGFMFSIYLVMYKKKLGRQMRQLAYTYLPEKNANQILYICHLTSHNFKAFIYGQVLEAIILFVMYIVVAMIARLPYSFMIATMIGIFSLIPLFGGYIGWAIGVFLILPINPFQALIFTIIFFVISQVEGNFIYPRIVGNSIGLPGIWVLAAVTVGGNLLGITGMILAVPIVALCYTLISEDSQKRLRKKKHLIKKILHKPKWSHYNYEKEEFEDHPVKIHSILTEKVDEAKPDSFNGDL